jgi:hypothetical protein
MCRHLRTPLRATSIVANIPRLQKYIKALDNAYFEGPDTDLYTILLRGATNIRHLMIARHTDEEGDEESDEQSDE